MGASCPRPLEASWEIFKEGRAISFGKLQSKLLAKGLRNLSLWDLYRMSKATSRICAMYSYTTVYA
jgi:hypothetical protein